MKTSIFKKCALVGALALPMGGVAFGGVQALTTGIAGASTSCHMAFGSGSTLSFDDGGVTASTVSLPTGAQAGSCTTSSGSAGTYQGTFTITGTFAGYNATITAPVTAAYSATGSVTSVVFDNSSSIAFTSGVLNGCTLVNLGNNGDNATGLLFDSGNPMSLEGDIGLGSNANLTSVAVGNTSCGSTGVAQLNAAIAMQLDANGISSSVTSGTVTWP